jgi:hypothetical protein
MALLPLLCVVLLVAAVGLGAAVARSAPLSGEAAVAAARKHASMTVAAAWVVSVLAAAATGVTLDLGMRQHGVAALAVPLAFGIAHVAVLLAGELTWPRPDGIVRRARLHRRGLLGGAARWQLWVGAVGLALAAVTVAVGAVTGNDHGRGIVLTGAGGLIQSGASPFAGWYYGRPAAMGLTVLGLLALVTLWVVAQRSAVATEDDAAETALRRASAHRVLRVADAVLLFVTGGLMTVSGNAVHSAASSITESAAANGLSAGGHVELMSVVGAWVGPLGLVTALAGLVVLVVPAPAVPADRRESLLPVLG